MNLLLQLNICTGLNVILSSDCKTIQNLLKITCIIVYKRCLYFGFTSSLHSWHGNSFWRNGSYQKFTARFLPCCMLGYDWTSCHQNAGRNNTSPSSIVQFIGLAWANLGNLSKSGLSISTGDITIEVLSTRWCLLNCLLVSLYANRASGMWASYSLVLSCGSNNITCFLPLIWQRKLSNGSKCSLPRVLPSLSQMLRCFSSKIFSKKRHF